MALFRCVGSIFIAKNGMIHLRSRNQYSDSVLNKDIARSTYWILSLQIPLSHFAEEEGAPPRQRGIRDYIDSPDNRDPSHVCTNSICVELSHADFVLIR